MKKDKIISITFALIVIILGVLIVIYPTVIFDRYMRLLAILIIADGIYAIIAYSKKENYLALSSMIILAAGVISIICGLNLFFYPGNSITVLSVVLPIWFIAHHSAKISELLSIKRKGSCHHLALVIDIIVIILSLLMVIYPYHAFIDIEMLIACSFILLGVEVIMTSMNRKMMYN